MTPLPPKVDDCLHRHFCAHLPKEPTWHWLGHDHAESAVWGATVDGQLQAVLKCQRARRKFDLEVAAYRQWARVMPATADLIDVHAGEPHALLLTALAGTPADSQVFDNRSTNDLHQAAGAWLAQWHDLPFTDSDPLELPPALHQRWQHTRSVSTIEPALIAQLDADLERSIAAADCPRVPCHRDFRPRNWMAAADGRFVGVIDFEHSRSDLWLADLVRLASGPWRTQPETEQAFWTGYRRRPSAVERQLLQVLTAIDAVATLNWAAHHQDTTFVREAEATLAAYRQGAVS